MKNITTIKNNVCDLMQTALSGYFSDPEIHSENKDRIVFKVQYLAGAMLRKLGALCDIHGLDYVIVKHSMLDSMEIIVFGFDSITEDDDPDYDDITSFDDLDEIEDADEYADRFSDLCNRAHENSEGMER